MRKISFDELCSKEVISCCDCSRLGYITDLCFDVDSSLIISVCIEQPGSLFNFFKRKTITLPWECVKKIGDDLIIVEYIFPQGQRQEKKSFFGRILGK